MGNYISCTLSPTAATTRIRGAKVIFPRGEIRQFNQPIQAAEIMLETPQYFLVNSRSLHIGRRFSALNADEELEMGNVYVLFPMKRVNSVITAADMGVLFLTANSAANRVARVMPAEAGGVEGLKRIEEPRSHFDGIDDVLVSEFQHRLSICRSRKPLLETITEEPVCLR